MEKLNNCKQNSELFLVYLFSIVLQIIFIWFYFKDNLKIPLLHNSHIYLSVVSVSRFELYMRKIIWCLYRGNILTLEIGIRKKNIASKTSLFCLEIVLIITESFWNKKNQVFLYLRGKKMLPHTLGLIAGFLLYVKFNVWFSCLMLFELLLFALIKHTNTNFRYF